MYEMLDWGWGEATSLFNRYMPFNNLCIYRIQDVVVKPCVITWSKKIYTQLINYVQDTIRRIVSMCSDDTEKKKSKHLIKLEHGIP